MGSRGRLIFPFRAQIYPLNPAASTYDATLREPVMAPSADRYGLEARVESAAILIPAQIEEITYRKLQMIATGHAPDGQFDLVMHFSDLAALGLVSAVTGETILKVGDRLGAIYTRSGALVQSFPNPPGLYVVEVRPAGFGLSGGQRNLLVVRVADRRQG